MGNANVYLAISLIQRKPIYPVFFLLLLLVAGFLVVSIGMAREQRKTGDSDKDKWLLISLSFVAMFSMMLFVYFILL